MSLKSLEYRLQVALAIAKNDINAKIIIAVGTPARASYVFALLCQLGADVGMGSIRSKELYVYKGGRIKVLSCTGEPSDYMGYSMTHVWLDETLDKSFVPLLTLRVRSMLPHPVPPGVYDQFGVTRRMDY